MIPAIVQVKQKESLSMKSQEKFTYSYSASQKAEIEAIRRKYLPRQETRMEELRRLDSAVTKKSAAFDIAWGTLFAQIFGGGLSLSLEQSGTLLLAGIALGLPGLIGMLLTYPLYVRLERRGREKIAERILAISDELLHETKRN